MHCDFIKSQWDVGTGRNLGAEQGPELKPPVLPRHRHAQSMHCARTRSWQWHTLLCPLEATVESGDCRQEQSLHKQLERRFSCSLLLNT